MPRHVPRGGSSAPAQWREITMRLFHATSTESAAAIVSEGFKDGEGHFGTNMKHRGVWLSDSPVDVNEGAKADEVVLAVNISKGLVKGFEWIEEGKGFREFLIPAALLNEQGRISIVHSRK